MIYKHEKLKLIATLNIDNGLYLVSYEKPQTVCEMTFSVPYALIKADSNRKLQDSTTKEEKEKLIGKKVEYDDGDNNPDKGLIIAVSIDNYYILTYEGCGEDECFMQNEADFIKYHKILPK